MAVGCGPSAGPPRAISTFLSLFSEHFPGSWLIWLTSLNLLTGVDFGEQFIRGSLTSILVSLLCPQLGSAVGFRVPLLVAFTALCGTTASFSCHLLNCE